MKQPVVHKTYLKTWCIGKFYNYNLFEIDAGGNKWIEATPITKGVTRTANNEEDLRVILEHDAMAINKFWQKVR